MAEKQQKVEKKVVSTKEEPTKVWVGLETSSEDVVAYDQAGASLFFNKKKFRVLDKEHVDALSFDNRKRYLETKAILDREAEARKPMQRVEVLDPLGGHAGAILDVRITDEKWAKEWHVCWKYANSVDHLGESGYVRVEAGKDPVRCGLKPAGSYFVMKDPKSREDLDIILMKIKMVTFLQHQNAVAQISRDKITGFQEKFAEQVEENSEGRLRGTVEYGKDEAVALKQSDLRPSGS